MTRPAVSERSRTVEQPSGRKLSSNGPDLSTKVIFRMCQTTNTIHTLGYSWVCDVGLPFTTQQWSVLGALSRRQVRDGMSVGELCEYLGVSRQNLSVILTRLERIGLTQRINREADRRVKSVILTPQGELIWSKIKGHISKFHRTALADFSDAEKSKFLDYIDRVKRNLRSNGRRDRM